MRHLELRHESGGDRHYIGESPIHCGDGIRAIVNGRLVHGRYEANYAAGQIRSAWFYFDEDDAVRLTDESLVEVDR